MDTTGLRVHTQCEWNEMNETLSRLKWMDVLEAKFFVLFMLTLQRKLSCFSLSTIFQYIFNGTKLCLLDLCLFGLLALFEWIFFLKARFSLFSDRSSDDDDDNDSGYCCCCYYHHRRRRCWWWQKFSFPPSNKFQCYFTISSNNDDQRLFVSHTHKQTNRQTKQQKQKPIVVHIVWMNES